MNLINLLKQIYNTKNYEEYINTQILIENIIGDRWLKYNKMNINSSVICTNVYKLGKSKPSSYQMETFDKSLALLLILSDVPKGRENALKITIN